MVAVLFIRRVKIALYSVSATPWILVGDCGLEICGTIHAYENANEFETGGIVLLVSVSPQDEKKEQPATIDIGNYPPITGDIVAKPPQVRRSLRATFTGKEVWSMKFHVYTFRAQKVIRRTLLHFPVKPHVCVGASLLLPFWWHSAGNTQAQQLVRTQSECSLFYKEPKS